ncbi:alpha/beta fold hydrolase [Flagellimonas sp.]|uniref:alpha/beta fold hydrolase n=1 Tax=Flagellimonas sp. TaxID=2058762 RepID=UPI003B513B36
MKKNIFILILILKATIISSQTPSKSEFVVVNGKKIHYERYGKGDPLLFLHGYSLSSKSWESYVSDFDKEYEVYLIDLTGHGKSTPFTEQLSIRNVANDLLALIQHLGLKKIKAVGFSFGGDILYQLALLNPDLIESMITIGAMGTWDVNDFPQYQKGYTYENKDNFPWLKTSHETDDHIKALMHQFKNYTVYLSNEELQKISPEVLVMMGDDDEGMDFDEVARVKKHLPKSDIWILPNVSHGAHENENKEEFVIKAKKFLAKDKNTKK